MDFTLESANGIEDFSCVFERKDRVQHRLMAPLYLPAACADGARVLAVMIQQGSGPTKWSWYVEVATRLKKAGIAALVPDSHTARGIAATTRDQSQLSMTNRVFDSFPVFQALQRVPRINSARIGVTGYGVGGMVSRDMVESALADHLGGGQIVKVSLPVSPTCLLRWDVVPFQNSASVLEMHMDLEHQCEHWWARAVIR